MAAKKRGPKQFVDGGYGTVLLKMSGSSNCVAEKPHELMIAINNMVFSCDIQMNK